MNNSIIYNKVRVAPRCFLLLAGLLTLSACSDWRDGITATSEQPDDQPVSIAFAGSVLSSQVPTRADGSLVNLKETSLLETKERTYYRANADGSVPEAGTKAAYYVGVFGCYTGQHKWSDLVKEANMTDSEIDALTADEKEARTARLNEYYTANLLYNQQATIKAAPTGSTVNQLEYAPLRFWPNNKLTADATQHEYCTFFAYYPYNPTAIPGTYGISITESSIGQGKGMGRVNFTMHPDASQQNDFMISAPVTDCNRDQYPLTAVGDPADGSYTPKPVQFRFYHMLAQVRLYAFIRGTDKLVYQTDGEGNPVYYAAGETYTDAWGKEHTVTSEEAGTIQKIDEAKSVRWKRTNYYDIRGEKKRAEISYKMEFNNIKTSADFYPKYDAEGKNATIDYTDATTLGSATVNHYIMNPYWFRFDETDQHRYMLNDNYMYGHFEDTPVYKRENATKANGGLDGIDWSDGKWDALYNLSSGNKNTPLHYLDLTEGETRRKELQDPNDPDKHYNYAPGNILMVVPQTLTDEQVPNIVLTATGTRTKWNDSKREWEDAGTVTAKVTINLLQMNLRWDSGFIYSYAIIDELHPGDDIVRGPESIDTYFDTKQWTDQW